MTDSEPSLDQFFDDVDTALEEYDKGYVDADATLQVVRSHVEDLREAVEE